MACFSCVRFSVIYRAYILLKICSASRVVSFGGFADRTVSLLFSATAAAASFLCYLFTAFLSRSFCILLNSQSMSVILLKVPSGGTVEVYGSLPCVCFALDPADLACLAALTLLFGVETAASTLGVGA